MTFGFVRQTFTRSLSVFLCSLRATLLPIVLSTTFLSQPASADDWFFQSARVADWTLYRDGNYCWMRTATQIDPQRMMALAIDINGELYLREESQARGRLSDTLLHEIIADGKSIQFSSDGSETAWPESRDADAIRKAVFSEQIVWFAAHLVIGKKTRTFSGKFSTQRGSEAFQKLRSECRT